MDFSESKFRSNFSEQVRELCRLGAPPLSLPAAGSQRPLLHLHQPGDHGGPGVFQKAGSVFLTLSLSSLSCLSWISRYRGGGSRPRRHQDHVRHRRVRLRRLRTGKTQHYTCRYAYSYEPNPWDWLTTKEKAESMAEVVAKWRTDYGIDGIDLDIEAGAGDKAEAGPNMVHFIRRLKSLQPNMLVTQPTYGNSSLPAPASCLPLQDILRSRRR